MKKTDISDHTFGGDWTEEKLARVREYLSQYRQVFKKQTFLRTWYVDGFAGTGTRADREASPEQSTTDHLFEDVYDDTETNTFRQGSATIALSLEDPFDRYLFIDQRQRHVDALATAVKESHPALLERCEFKRGNANEVLKQWCAERDWKSERAVVFLDPYGMQVEWTTIEALAATRGIDLWYLFPLGIGVSRLLTRDGAIDELWCRRLDLLFGTADWRTRFYNVRQEEDLFGSREVVERDAPAEKIQKFIEERLKTCFVKVADGLILRNSRANPLYSLCFAAANERGAPIALRIAQYILKKAKPKGR